jgi:hypothetical protein
MQSTDGVGSARYRLPCHWLRALVWPCPQHIQGSERIACNLLERVANCSPWLNRTLEVQFQRVEGGARLKYVHKFPARSP